MVRVSDPDIAFRVIRALELTRAVFYVQRVIEHGGARRARVRRRRSGRRAPSSAARREAAGARTCRSAATRAPIELSAGMVEHGRSSRARGRRRLRRRRPAARARRHGLRARGERHSRLAGPAAATSRRRRGARSSISSLAQGGRVIATAATPLDVGRAAQLACLLEVSAPKPGNVSPGQRLRRRALRGFLASAAAIGTRSAAPAPDRSARRSCSRSRGDEPLDAHEHEPRHRAAARAARPRGPAVVAARDWLDRRVIDATSLRAALGRGARPATTVEDARHVYAAIRAASPGGLGRPPSQDVPASRPCRSRGHAAGGRSRRHRARVRDGLSRYLRGGGAGARRARAATGCDWNDAVVETFLTLLAAPRHAHRAARRTGAGRRRDRAARARCSPPAACGRRRPRGNRADATRAARRPQPREPGHDRRHHRRGDLRGPAWRRPGNRSTEGRMPSVCNRAMVVPAIAIACRSPRITSSSRRRTSSRSPGHRCETLHGHNYRVGVTVEGALDRRQLVRVRFRRAQAHHAQAVRRHRPQGAARRWRTRTCRSPKTGDSVTVAYDGKPRYVFPKRDCALLPVPNTTVEMLAELLTDAAAGRAREAGRRAA